MTFFLDTPMPEASPIVPIADDQIDPRLTRLSYSSGLTLHGCPRKYQLSRLQAERAPESTQDSITFAFGHAVGEGVQWYMITKCRDTAVMKALLLWDCDLFDEDPKRNKSFAIAYWALEQFFDMCDNGFLDDYEVAKLNGEPAAELSFRVQFPMSTYRGFVDLVLRHRITGELLVLELKTDSGTWVNHYKYKNSSQAIGYSVILDQIEPECSAYGVQYLVYMSKLNRWEVFDFPKTMYQRALWIEDRLWDERTIITLIETRGNYGAWPMQGEYCTTFGKTCEFMDTCHMHSSALIAPLRERDLEEEAKYTFEFHYTELLGIEANEAG